MQMWESNYSLLFVSSQLGVEIIVAMCYFNFEGFQRPI